MDSGHRRNRSWVVAGFRMALIVMLVCGSGLANGAVEAAPNATVVVSPTNPQGWGFAQETATGTGSFAAGPATAPLGTGSARLVVDGTGGVVIGNLANYLNTRLDAITALSYSTYRASGATILAPALQLSLDYNLTDTITSFQGRLVFEPLTAGTVMTGAWQTWNPLSTGGWFATRAPFKATCSQAAPCSWAQVLGNWPNAGIYATATPLSKSVFLKVGGGWVGGFDGNVDALTIGVNGSNTTFDF